MRTMRAIWILTLAMATLWAAHSEAIAAATTANGNYQQYAKTTACASQPACTLTFAALPANKNLIVRQVSCFIALISGPVRYVALESYKATVPNPLARTFATPIAGTGAGFNTVTAELKHLVAAGQLLKVKTETLSGEVFSVECTVVGDLLSP
ncbi:MAG TPA: hypothetical protein VHM27_12835 [Rhizomicrobium sp.]|nr:hypothetical protein [Rhizomicrobium sp.]